MARLGDWEYPEINLSASIDVARKITREFSGEVSRTGLARSLGMSERGGAFASRLAAIRLWGIATGRSRIRLTRDGLRAARPHSPSEAQLAMRDLAQSVPLFVELGKRLPQSSPGPEHLAVFVEEITGADQTAVGQSVTTIDRVFREVRQYLDDSGEPYGSSGDQDRRESHDSPESELQTDRGGVSSSTSWSERQVDTGGRLELSIPGASLSLPESLENLDLALTVLMARRRILAANDGSTGQNQRSDSGRIEN